MLLGDILAEDRAAMIRRAFRRCVVTVYRITRFLHSQIRYVICRVLGDTFILVSLGSFVVFVVELFLQRRLSLASYDEIEFPMTGFVNLKYCLVKYQLSDENFLFYLCMTITEREPSKNEDFCLKKKW
jgi:hypothetical protein